MLSNIPGKFEAIFIYPIKDSILLCVVTEDFLEGKKSLKAIAKI